LIFTIATPMRARRAAPSPPLRRFYLPRRAMPRHAIISPLIDFHFLIFAAADIFAVYARCLLTPLMHAT